MTLNLGWISESAVCLVTDTLVTKPGPSQRGMTSLGQTTQRDDGLAVEEAAAKLVPLGPHAAAALCGDAAGAIALVTTALNSIKYGTPVWDAILRAGHSVHQNQPPFGDFSLLVAMWDSGPKLLLYESRTLALADVSDNSPVTRGSLRAELQDRIRREIQGTPKLNRAREYALAPALAILQSLAASENLIEDMVGGIFYGLQINADGLHWQPSLLYVFHQDVDDAATAPPWNIVNCRILDGVCTVGSSLARQVRCFVPPGGYTDRSAWMSRWEESLGTAAALDTCRAVAFIRVLGGSVVLLPNDGTHFGHYWDDKGLCFAISPELQARLGWRPTAEQPHNYSLGLPPPAPTE